MTNKYLDAVETLNAELFENHGETEKSFWYRTTSFVDQIGFDDTVIWCSEADGTQYWGDTDKEIPIIDAVRRRFNLYVESLERLKF